MKHGFLETSTPVKGAKFQCQCGHQCKTKAGLSNHIRISTFGGFRNGSVKNLYRTTAGTHSPDLVMVKPGRFRPAAVAMDLKLFPAPPSPPTSSSSSSAEETTSKKGKLAVGGASYQDRNNNNSPPPKRARVIKTVTKATSSRRLRHAAHAHKPLECICGLKWLSAHQLAKHVDYYKMDRKFACKLCPRLFVNQGYLNSHYRTQHKNYKLFPRRVDGRKRKYKRVYK